MRRVAKRLAAKLEHKAAPSRSVIGRSGKQVELKCHGHERHGGLPDVSS